MTSIHWLTTLANTFKKARHELMDGVPTILEIAIPQLQDVKQHVMRVRSSSNRAAKLAFELPIDNIEYLSRAVHAEALAATHPRQRASRRKPFSALTPDVFLSRGGNMMLCRYKDGNGKTKKALANGAEA